MSYQIKIGDCLESMRGMADDSVDAIVTDPPYGLSFMGKKWDYDVPQVEVWREVLRVLKPGGHLLAFAGTRTQHRMAVNIEDAGFEIRDMIAWVYSSGFPKSLDVSKAIDKAAGAEREVVGSNPNNRDRTKHEYNSVGNVGSNATITAPATEAAKQWQGWGTAIKPALEPITVARKPFSQTVAANVLEWGTGGLNVDKCRVGSESTKRKKAAGANQFPHEDDAWLPRAVTVGSDLGRWPANLIHDGSDEVVGLFPVTTSGARNGASSAKDSRLFKLHGAACEGSTGSAARFFYCAKASKRDRDEGCEGLEDRDVYSEASPTPMRDQRQQTQRRNTHPTVKPTSLMQYLCRLVTPPNGTILDPYMGSGSTGKAAMLEGFSFIGCEMDAEYAAIADARIQWAVNQKQGELAL